MLRITAPDENADAGKAFADACWRANPKISPDAWRVGHGWTVAKVWRQVADMGGVERGLAVGINGYMVAKGGVIDPQHPLRAAMVVVGVIEGVVEGVVGLDVVLWGYDPLRDAADWVAGFEAFEQAVMDGRLRGYGVALGEAEGVDMGGLWSLAQRAAAAAWGRRKKPALRMVSGTLGVVELGLLQVECCRMGEETVSVLEWAARQDVMVIAMEPVVAKVEEAEAAGLVAPLVRVAELEQEVWQALEGGWPVLGPVVGGEPVFSVLRHVQAGVLPWPGGAVLEQFRAVVWPELRQVWAQVAAQRPAVAGVVGDYVAGLDKLVANGAGLAGWSGLRWAERVRLEVKERLPERYRSLPDGVWEAGVVASIPGVAGVVLPPGMNEAGDEAAGRLLMETPNVADIGAVLL